MIVDDGIATGATALAAAAVGARAARADRGVRGAGRAAGDGGADSRAACDVVVLLQTPARSRRLASGTSGSTRSATRRSAPSLAASGMRPFEFAVAAGARGARGPVAPSTGPRRPFDSTRSRDQLLFALFLTGRVGIVVPVRRAGSASSRSSANRTRAETRHRRLAVDDPSRYRWYIIVFAVARSVQLLAGWFLGHGGPVDRGDGRVHDADRLRQPTALMISSDSCVNRCRCATRSVFRRLDDPAYSSARPWRS